MKYDDKKAIDNGYGGYDFVQVESVIDIESVIDELRSDCTKNKCDFIQDYIYDYRNKIEELENRVKELEEILDNNDIKY